MKQDRRGFFGTIVAACAAPFVGRNLEGCGLEESNFGVIPSGKPFSGDEAKPNVVGFHPDYFELIWPEDHLGEPAYNSFTRGHISSEE